MIRPIFAFLASSTCRRAGNLPCVDGGFGFALTTSLLAPLFIIGNVCQESRLLPPADFPHERGILADLIAELLPHADDHSVGRLDVGEGGLEARAHL
jgi:hypothetical protein